ncbi:hypothetical protein GCM10022267_87300 [Lentzea roselyniae]|uniref:Uncharacterized protein n=1 Tax=Lentzea roselyniae TaxID=531940 RepID=A0ABP7CF71_9PSEU
MVSIKPGTEHPVRSLDPACRRSPAPRPAETADGPAATPSQDWPHTIRWCEVPPEPAEPAVQNGRWLLLHGGSRFDDLLGERLAAAGCSVSVVRHGWAYAAEGAGHYRAVPDSTQDLAQVLREVSRDGTVQGVVSLWATATRPARQATPENVQWTVTGICAQTTALVRALATLKTTSS